MLPGGPGTLKRAKEGREEGRTSPCFYSEGMESEVWTLHTTTCKDDFCMLVLINVSPKLRASKEESGYHQVRWHMLATPTLGEAEAGGL